MEGLLFAAAAAFVVTIAGPASAQPSPASPGDASAKALSALLADWDRIGFDTPSKPMQYRVYGRDGSVIDGPGYNAVVFLIRSAIKDSRAGRNEEAVTKLDRARRLLGSSART
jgi:hypothetical protein